MANSGSYDYTVTAGSVITAACEDLQLFDPTQTIDQYTYATALRTLNLMTKEWMGKPTFAPGLKRWTRKYMYLFLGLNKNVYELGQGGGDPACLLAYNGTTLTAAASSSSTTIEIANTTSWPTGVQGSGVAIADNDIIGILTVNGDWQWTVVNAGGGTNTIELADALKNDAANGAYVYSYSPTAAVDLPLDFITCVRRDINGIDYAMDKMFAEYEYEQITKKNITSTPIRWWYEKQQTTGNIYLDCFPFTLTDVLRIRALYPIDDEDSLTNDMAFPQQWYGALEWGLAKKLCPKYGKAWTDTMEQNYMEAMSSASAVDAETVPQYFQPNRDDYGSNFAGTR